MRLQAFFGFALALCCTSATAQAIATDPSLFCKDSQKRSAKFNDVAGFSNMSIRQDGFIKVYREIASSGLDWAVYDGYTFSNENGKRLLFSRAVIYAGNSIVYVETIDADGRESDNKMIMPSGFYIPAEPRLSRLDDFCKLQIKTKK